MAFNILERAGLDAHSRITHDRLGHPVSLPSYTFHTRNLLILRLLSAEEYGDGTFHDYRTLI